MESAPKLKSISKLYRLTSIEGLNNYALALEKIHNNLQKYSVVDNEIKEDILGDPYVILQYMNIEDVAECNKQKVSYFAELLSVPSRLEDFDNIVTKHWSNELVMTFCHDYSNRDKMNPILYKIVIYFVVIKGGTVDKKEVDKVKPISKKKG